MVEWVKRSRKIEEQHLRPAFEAVEMQRVEPVELGPHALLGAVDLKHHGLGSGVGASSGATET